MGFFFQTPGKREEMDETSGRVTEEGSVSRDRDASKYRKYLRHLIKIHTEVGDQG